LSNCALVGGIYDSLPRPPSDTIWDGSRWAARFSTHKRKQRRHNPRSRRHKGPYMCVKVWAHREASRRDTQERPQGHKAHTRVFAQSAQKRAGRPSRLSLWPERPQRHAHRVSRPLPRPATRPDFAFSTPGTRAGPEEPEKHQIPRNAGRPSRLSRWPKQTRRHVHRVH
jgi:hypothetical protein